MVVVREFSCYWDLICSDRIYRGSRLTLGEVQYDNVYFKVRCRVFSRVTPFQFVTSWGNFFFLVGKIPFWVKNSKSIQSVFGIERFDLLVDRWLLHYLQSVPKLELDCQFARWEKSGSGENWVLFQREWSISGNNTNPVELFVRFGFYLDPSFFRIYKL